VKPAAALKLKPAAERLYGRTRGNTLRPRQQLLLDVTLPRLRLDPSRAADPMSAFPDRPAELWLEVGFGGGEHARAQVEAHPEAGLVACEVYANGICSLLSAVVPEGGELAAPLPPNLLVWTDDARILLRQIPPGSLSRLFLMFPDPWPKARHTKRRFMHPDTVSLVAQAMRPGGEWRIATDDPTYQAWTASVLAEQSLFTATAPATTRPEGWPPTRYEQKALKAGRTPLYWSVTRRPTGRV
jgi:tRNA (guanine-N7-)-methyltransferase